MSEMMMFPPRNEQIQIIFQLSVIVVLELQFYRAALIARLELPVASTVLFLPEFLASYKAQSAEWSSESTVHDASFAMAIPKLQVTGRLWAGSAGANWSFEKTMGMRSATSGAITASQLGTTIKNSSPP